MAEQPPNPPGGPPKPPGGPGNPQWEKIDTPPPMETPQRPGAGAPPPAGAGQVPPGGPPQVPPGGPPGGPGGPGGPSGPPHPPGGGPPGPPGGGPPGPPGGGPPGPPAGHPPPHPKPAEHPPPPMDDEPEPEKKHEFQPVVEDPDWYGDGPIFIYGGPWIEIKKPSMFLDQTTPLNVQLSGTYKKSHAYYSLKERTPSMLTKVIDVASKRQYPGFVAFIAKLKHDLVTNKPYAKFTGDDEEYQKWNDWIDAQNPKTYFGNNWCFTECYVYRKIQEGIELNNLPVDFDPFEEIKKDAVRGNIEPMCVIAEKMLEFNQPTEELPERKAMWVQLLKASMWANRCDLSQSLGEKAELKDVCPLPILPFPKPTAKPKPLKKGKLPPVAPPLTDVGYIDPFQISLDLKANLLADDSAKSFGPLMARTKKIRANIQKVKDKDPDKPEPNWLELFPSGGKKKGKGGKKKNPPPPPPVEGEVVEPKEEPKKIPCPAKMNVAQHVFLDIVCDNTGYELFTDICIGHWVVAQGIVDKVRFHVKKYPWFVSDVTRKDFTYLVNQCKSASFSKDAIRPERPPPPPPKPLPDGTIPPPPPEPPRERSIRSSALNQIAQEWQKFLDEGTFIVMDDDFWTYPHTYKDMKRLDPYMYRKLQYAAMIIFKGDLNYRKLVGDRNCVPATPLEPNLQGFIPAPIVALRTVKSETVCALPKGRYEQVCKFDPKWMEKGNFGVITMCKKAEAFPKQPNMPCVDYGRTCFGEGCPEHADF